MTTLELFCNTFGWQGGTIHQARERFAVASMEEMNKFCSAVMKNLSELTDPEEATWFMKHRMKASGLVIREVKASKHG